MSPDVDLDEVDVIFSDFFSLSYSGVLTLKVLKPFLIIQDSHPHHGPPFGREHQVEDDQPLGPQGDPGVSAKTVTKVLNKFRKTVWGV